MSLFKTLALSAVAAIAMAGAAQAGTINFAGINPSGTSFSGTDSTGFAYDLTATGGSFQKKTLNGRTGLGVSGGESGGEIDPGQSITLAYGTGGLAIKSIELLFLYNGPEFNDPLEVAIISGNGTEYTLSITGENTAAWSGMGAMVENCGVTTASGSGCFRILNPFGNDLVNTISFTAKDTPTGRSNSDYSLASITAVPEPATLALLGAGLLGAGALRRRRQA